MPYALWTRAAVGELIEQRLGIRLPVRTIGLYLARWGFTPHKPMKKAYEQSPAAVKKWHYAGADGVKDRDGVRGEPASVGIEAR